MIVNELSNGPSGSKEFYELMVVGDAGNPTGAVNLNGWIIDDNNGDWQGSMTGIGISSGYARINTALNPGSCGALNAVTPGSILVIYNSSDINANVPADDFADSNGDGVFIFSAGSACIEICRSTPSSSSPVYSACVPSTSQSYNAMRLRNLGDVGQVRDPSAIFVHGFAYGDLASPYPTGSFNINPLTGLQRTFIFNCGDWTQAANFRRLPVGSETPGGTNSAANEVFRQRVINGTLNYSNLSDPANCDIDPDISVTKTSSVDFDPINMSSNPKAIPGSEIIYSLVIENSGFGNPDGSTVVIVDALPAEVSLFVGNFSGGSPVGFTDGAPPSALSLVFGGLPNLSDGIDFSNNGGTSFAYVPVPDTDGFDGNITHLRINPSGIFAASDGVNHPSFAIEFKVRVD